MNSLGSRLKAMREQNNFTQVEVSKMLDISNGTLSGYERNYREPDAKTIIKLAELYHVTTDYLLTGYKISLLKDNPLTLYDNQNKEIARDLTTYEREFLIRSLTLLREAMAKADRDQEKVDC